MSETQQEVLVSPDLKVELKQVAIPRPPEPTDVVIKVEVSGFNPKDWKYPEWRNLTFNSGDDIAGTVHEVGSAVTAFRPGDRVWAFHVMGTPHGSFAQYAVAPQHTTAHLPKHISFEEGAAVPLAALTAGVGLFVRLGLPLPWAGGAHDGFEEKNKDESKSLSGVGVGGKTLQRSGPLLVYGAATAVGAYAIQLAKRAGIGPIIGVAGRGIPFVESLLDAKAGDVVLDYRKGDDALVAGIQAALKPGEQLLYAFDAVSEHNSSENISKVIKGPGAKLTRVLPYPKDTSFVPSGVDATLTMVGNVHKEQTDFGAAMTAWINKGLQEGWFRAHPQTVVPGGLTGVAQALKGLKAGEASATKYVVRISETPGLA